MSQPAGTYTLILELDALRCTVGALGELRFDAGIYAYVGSAHGPGGFARVDRHRVVARGEHDVRHWHIDYLLGAPTTSVTGAVRLPNRAVECQLARGLDADAATGFGASDCACDSHLAALGPAGTLDISLQQLASVIADLPDDGETWQGQGRSGSDGRPQS